MLVAALIFSGILSGVGFPIGATIDGLAHAINAVLGLATTV